MQNFIREIARQSACLPVLSETVNIAIKEKKLSKFDKSSREKSDQVRIGGEGDSGEETDKRDGGWKIEIEKGSLSQGFLKNW